MVNLMRKIRRAKTAINFIKKFAIERAREIVMIAIIIGLFGSGITIIWASTLKIPDFNSFEERKITQSTKIYDRTGKVVLFDVHKDIKRTVIPFEDISRHVKNATIAIEDSEFYEHNGIKPTAILRALLTNILSGNLTGQGGSTITQQVVKNSVLNKDKNLTRKLKEAILSIKIERVLDKDKIFSLYLNEIPYGGNIYGVEEASQRFFGKSARDITLAESAYLAALPKAPTFYSPYGNNKDRLDERKNVVLARMEDLGFITKEEKEQATKEEVLFTPPENSSIRAPHFVTHVRLYLEEKYGKETVETGGLKVITTLDWELQQKAEEIVKRFGDENEQKFNAKNAGLVAVDPKSGNVLVMVGSRDYFDTEKEGNFNVTIAHRQPGSAFKPFVYATAFAKGYTPETILFDLETEFNTACGVNSVPPSPTVKCYNPGNFDEKFRGPMTLRDALAQSINIPAVKLLYLAGIKDSIQTARNMGVSGLSDPNRYGLTLVLGGGEVTLLDMTSAYAVFANEGVRNKTSFILKVEDADGKILESFDHSPQEVLDQNVARTISDILSDNEARTPIFGSQSLLRVPGYDVAVKTGTTNDFKDAWAVGYSPNIAVGAWAGNNDNTPMDRKIAGLIITPMWHEFIKTALETMPKEEFNPPQKNSSNNLKPVLRGVWKGGNEFLIDKISGKLATEYTPEETTERKVINEVHSILYWLDKDNPLTSGKPQNPENDPQFILWEYPIRKWAQENGVYDQTTEIIPKQTDDVHKPEFRPKVSILSPISDRTYLSTEKISIIFNSTGRFPTSQADFFLNETYLGSTKNSPFSFNFVPEQYTNIGNENEIKIVVYDSARNKTEVKTKLILSDI